MKKEGHLVVTVDEASKCPKCRNVGVIGNARAERHYIDREWWDVYAYVCTNQDCPWYNTGWAVSSNERGEVYERPEAERNKPKTFVKMTPDQLALGRRMIEDVEGRDLRDEK